MRIAHFYGHGGANGITSSIPYLVAGLRARGHAVNVLCRTDSVLAQDPRNATYRWLPGNLHRAALRERLRALLKDEAIQVLTVHSHRDSSFALGVAREAGVPSCYYVRELSHTAAVPAKDADIVIAVSPGVAHFLREAGGPPSSAAIVTICNGIDEETLPLVPRGEARRKWRFADEDVVVGFAGRLTRNKNVGALVTVCARLAASLPHLRLMIIGDGKRAPSIRLRAVQLGFASRLTMPGWISRAETVGAIAAMDVLVLSSLGCEGLSQSLLEAMLLGVPVLASDIPSLVGGPVRHGETGWLFQPADNGSLQQALRDILALSTSAREEIGVAARAEVRAHYTLTGGIEQLEGVYEGLIAGSRGPT